MVKYQQYPEYKDSGAEWLGKVPKEWNLLRSKRIFKNYRQPAFNEDEQLAASQKYGVIPQSLMMKRTGNKVMLALKGTSSFKHVEKGNFVISLRSFEGGIEYSDYDGCVSPAYTVLRAVKNIFPNFYRYLFKSRPFITALQSSTDSLRDGKSITYEQFSNLSLIIPPKKEQIQIANFLDHETAKIDALIEKQQQLIELLKEKRQAVISHAVTKGLNPNIAMRDSGIEWLGEVPKHWQILKFNHCASIRNGQVDPTIKPYSLMILYAPNHIEKGTGKILFKENAKTQGADSGKYLCRKGEIIYSKIRPSLAKVALCEEEKALCSADMYPIKASNFILNKYLFFYLLSSSFTARTILDSDRVAMPKINRETLGDYKVPVPPIEEQKEIVSEIKNKSFRIDILIKKTNQMIELIQERRTALISAAVTGKIDVRNWQPPQSNHGESTHEQQSHQ